MRPEKTEGAQVCNHEEEDVSMNLQDYTNSVSVCVGKEVAIDPPPLPLPRSSFF